MQSFFADNGPHLYLLLLANSKTANIPTPITNSAAGEASPMFSSEACS